MTTNVDPDRRRSCCQVPVDAEHTLDCPQLLERAVLAGRQSGVAPFVTAQPTRLWRAILTVERVERVASTAPEAVRLELVDTLDELPAMVDELRAGAQAILEQKGRSNVNMRQMVELAYPQTGQASR